MTEPTPPIPPTLPNPPPTPPPTPPTIWHTGLDAEVLGHAQNKGWKLDDPKDVVTAAIKQARELERHFGVPADQLVKMPKADAKPEDLRAFYERIGAPKEAKDYDLTPIKDAPIADALRTALHDRGVTKDAAAAVATAVAKALDSKSTTDNSEKTVKLDAQKQALKTNWGDKFAYNHLQAIEGARKLGIAPDAVQALEGVIGYDKVMEAMRRIGANTSEDLLIGGDGPSKGVVSTREGAVARKAELMTDKDWAKRYLNGGAAERHEMDRLNEMLTG